MQGARRRNLLWRAVSDRRRRIGGTPEPAHPGMPATTGCNPIGLVKRSFAVSGHRTSVALEREFWSVLSAVAAERGQSLSALVAERDATRDSRQPLASALRVFALHASMRATRSSPEDRTSQEQGA